MLAALQALFITASVPTVTSTTATRTMTKGFFMVTSRPRPFTGRIFAVDFVVVERFEQSGRDRD